MAEFRNRIVGQGEEDPSQLLANPFNFRRHPKVQQEALEGALEEVGWIQRVIVNKRTGHMIDGHARAELAIRRNEASVPVLYVDLSEEEEMLALATFDPIGAMATTDTKIMAELAAGVETESDILRNLVTGLASGGVISTDHLYTRKIEAPIYEPKGEKPEPQALYDTTKADELTRAIEAADLHQDVLDFLRAAAQRHTVFDYASIAEFYAHADATTQALMEASALVIIDFDQAIEHGFVTLSERMQKLVQSEQGTPGDA